MFDVILSISSRAGYSGGDVHPERYTCLFANDIWHSSAPERQCDTLDPAQTTPMILSDGAANGRASAGLGRGHELFQLVSHRLDEYRLAQAPLRQPVRRVRDGLHDLAVPR